MTDNSVVKGPKEGGMTGGIPPLWEERRSSRYLVAAAVVLRQGLTKRGLVSNSVWSRMTSNH